MTAVMRYPLGEQLSYHAWFSMRLRHNATSGRQCFEREQVEVLLSGYRVLESKEGYALVETPDGSQYDLWAHLEKDE